MKIIAALLLSCFAASAAPILQNEFDTNNTPAARAAVATVVRGNTNLFHEFFMTNGGDTLKFELGSGGIFNLWFYDRTGTTNSHFQMLNNGGIAFGQGAPFDTRWEITAAGGAAVVSSTPINTDLPWAIQPALVMVDANGDLRSTNRISVSALGTTGNTPTVTTNLGAWSTLGINSALHAGDTVSIVGDDVSGVISFSIGGTTGGTASPANTNSLAVITFATPKASPPRVIWVQYGRSTSTYNPARFSFVGLASTTNWVLTAGGTALAASGVTDCQYLVIGQ